MKLPRYDGAACIGESEIMDGHTREDVVTALGLCNSCPILIPCQQFAQKLSRNHQAGHGLHGVIGGHIYGHARRHRKGLRAV